MSDTTIATTAAPPAAPQTKEERIAARHAAVENEPTVTLIQGSGIGGLPGRYDLFILCGTAGGNKHPLALARDRGDGSLGYVTEQGTVYPLANLTTAPGALATAPRPWSAWAPTPKAGSPEAQTLSAVARMPLNGPEADRIIAIEAIKACRANPMYDDLSPAKRLSHAVNAIAAITGQPATDEQKAAAATALKDAG